MRGAIPTVSVLCQPIAWRCDHSMSGPAAQRWSLKSYVQISPSILCLPGPESHVPKAARCHWPVFWGLGLLCSQSSAWCGLLCSGVNSENVGTVWLLDARALGSPERPGPAPRTLHTFFCGVGFLICCVGFKAGRQTQDMLPSA